MQATGSATQNVPAGHLAAMQGSPASIGILPPVPPPAEPPFPAAEPPEPPVVVPLGLPPAPMVVFPVVLPVVLDADEVAAVVPAPPAPEAGLPPSRTPSDVS